MRRLVATRRGRLLLGALVVFAAGATTVIVAVSGGAPPDVPTASVARGEFVEVVELRGEVRAVRTVVLAAPMQAGELQIVRLAKNGAAVKAGDVVVEFDSTTLRRTRQEKQSELRQAESEIDQARAQARIVEEQARTALMKARFDVERTALDVVDQDLVARIDLEKAKLALDDARQRLREAEARQQADLAASAADLAAKDRRREKVRQDLDRAERSLSALQLRAPSDGVVSLMANRSAGSPFGSAPDFREGDRAWGGAGILELPDMSAVRVTARLEEADRGRVAAGQSAAVRADAVPDRDYHATVSEISVLARVDFMSGWPPPRDFDIGFTMADADTRLRPGMSVAIRIAVGRIDNALLVPSGAVFLVDGRPTVYRLARSAFVALPVTVIKRGQEQAAIEAALSPDDRVALVKPPAKAVKGGGR